MKSTLKSIITVVVSCAFSLLAGCGRDHDKQAMREMELSYLRVLMPEDLLPFSNIEIAGEEQIDKVQEDSDPHLTLRLFEKNAKRSGGVRAEVSVNYPFKEGDTVRYEWSVRLADDFPSDAPANRWWLIGQWHDQPDKTKGESWDGFPSRSPPVLLGFGEKDGRIGLIASYGLRQEQVSGMMTLERGRWHRMAALIRWSRGEDGRADFFLDDMNTPAATFNGPNMHNAYQHYFKLGMYRHPEIATKNTLHLKSLQILHSSPP